MAKLERSRSGMVPEPAADGLYELARLAASGDKDATHRLLTAVTPSLARVVRAVLGPQHPDLDDATQRALMSYVDALPAYRGDCDPATYGRVIALHAAIAVRKKNLRDAARRAPAEAAEGIPSERGAPGESLLSARRMQIFRELIAELPTEQAEAFAMRVVLDLPFEEIAAHSGAPLNTVRSRLRLARERLKERIESDPRLREALGVNEP